jgi:hypothetical protein
MSDAGSPESDEKMSLRSSAILLDFWITKMRRATFPQNAIASPKEYHPMPICAVE